MKIGIKCMKNRIDFIKGDAFRKVARVIKEKINPITTGKKSRRSSFQVLFMTVLNPKKPEHFAFSYHVMISFA
ncbi:MAG TPA: hypothetical protein DCQ58_06745 [Saprospirales bacterium]|nr:hypothetical protein [Saprospirales bacterium]